MVGRTFTAYVRDRPDEAETFTIIGVLPQELWHFNSYTGILAPLRAPTYPYMVRLREGVAPQTAAERITSLVSLGAANVPQNWRAEVVSAHGQYVATVRPLLRTVTSAAAALRAWVSIERFHFARGESRPAGPEGNVARPSFRRRLICDRYASTMGFSPAFGNSPVEKRRPAICLRMS